MIKLGITGGLFPPNEQRTIFQKKQLCYLEKEFANYWASFGVMPILIPNLSPQLLPSFLEQLDALALLGGTDISPLQYGEQPIGEWHGDSLRDEYELSILDWFVQKEYPVFGICRGFQLLNVYFGGSLYQDLPSQYSKQVKHHCSKKYDLHTHPINLVKNELLDELGVNKSAHLVNSIHHQGIKRLAKDLVPIAHADDGLIEAFYYNNAPKGKVMGVQWHPEFFFNAAEKFIDDKVIIEHFLQFASIKPSLVK